MPSNPIPIKQRILIPHQKISEITVTSVPSGYTMSPQRFDIRLQDNQGFNFINRAETVKPSDKISKNIFQDSSYVYKKRLESDDAIKLPDT